MLLPDMGSSDEQEGSPAAFQTHSPPETLGGPRLRFNALGPLKHRPAPSPQPGDMPMPGSVRLHRVLTASPDKVYRAFIEADALAKWLPPNGFTCTVHELDAKVGGRHRASFRNFTTGHSHSFGGEYLELVPGERLRYTDRFDDPNLSGEIRVTVELKKVSCTMLISVPQETFFSSTVTRISPDRFGSSNRSV
jgi:uncharacterized protein YndB with AHSA1/START domain